MTSGHKHRTIKVPKWLRWLLQRPIWWTRNVEWADRSRFPFGSKPGAKEVDLDAEVWYLSTLSILHGWFGLCIWVEESE